MNFPPPPSPAVSSGNSGTTTTVNQVGVPQNTAPRMTHEEYLRRISLSQYVSEKETQTHNSREIRAHLTELVKKNPKIWDWERLKISKFGRDQWIDLAIQLYEKTGKLYHSGTIIKWTQGILNHQNNAQSSSSQHQHFPQFPDNVQEVPQQAQHVGEYPFGLTTLVDNSAAQNDVLAGEKEKERIARLTKMELQAVMIEMKRYFEEYKYDREKVYAMKIKLLTTLSDPSNR